MSQAGPLALARGLLTRKRCKATWKRESKLPWREAGPLNHLGDKVDPDQWVVNEEVSLSSRRNRLVEVALSRWLKWLFHVGF